MYLFSLLNKTNSKFKFQELLRCLYLHEKCLSNFISTVLCGNNHYFLGKFFLFEKKVKPENSKPVK